MSKHKIKIHKAASRRHMHWLSPETFFLNKMPSVFLILTVFSSLQINECLFPALVPSEPSLSYFHFNPYALSLLSLSLRLPLSGLLHHHFVFLVPLGLLYDWYLYFAWGIHEEHETGGASAYMNGVCSCGWVTAEEDDTFASDTGSLSSRSLLSYSPTHSTESPFLDSIQLWHDVCVLACVSTSSDPSNDKLFTYI